jgi:hypothetical protein
VNLMEHDGSIVRKQAIARDRAGRPGELSGGPEQDAHRVGIGEQAEQRTGGLLGRVVREPGKRRCFAPAGVRFRIAQFEQYAGSPRHALRRTRGPRATIARREGEANHPRTCRPGFHDLPPSTRPAL